MKIRYNTKKLLLAFDIFLFLVCLSGIYHIYLKADLPFSIYESDSHLFIDKQIFNSPLNHDDRIVSIDNYKFVSREHIEIYLDGKNIGDMVKISVERYNRQFDFFVNLIPFYTTFYLLIVLLVGVLFFLIAVIVLYKAENLQQAYTFHNVVICTAAIIMTTWGNHQVKPEWLGHLTRYVFHAAYTFAPALFLHFTLVFPTNRLRSIYIIPFYLLSLALTIILSIVFIPLSNINDISYSLVYIRYFNYTRIFVVISVLLAILIFILTYRKLRSDIDKKKLKWVLLGFIAGPVSFIVLWVIPQAITTNGLIPEEFILILMSAIPVTFGIAIVKYHLYDIDLIINRGVVYVIVISFLIVLYVSIIVGITYLVSVGPAFSSVLAAVLIALIFQPLKKYVQDFVDKKFFRIHYDFRKAINDTFKAIQTSTSISELADRIITEVNKLIPAEKIGIFTFNKHDNSLTIIRQINLPGFDRHKIFLTPKSVEELRINPIATFNSVEAGIPVQISEAKSLNKRNIALIFPVNVLGELVAVELMGKKKSGNRYYKEDFDLLNQLSNESAQAIERIQLQEKIILDRLEKEKLEELNRLKSYFVSSVSHEFKTPLTSIRIFTERLENNECNTDPKFSNHLKIIQGESDRLSRMIDNVLDLVKIERGIKNYRFTETDLNVIVEDSLRIMEYQLQMQKFTVNKNLVDKRLPVTADKDSIIECVVNIISNAMKYSRDEKEITIETDFSDSFVLVRIKDKGIGINQNDKEKIFEPYFRSEDKEARRVAGTGLGLAIVKHAMDFHHGRIEIESELNKGTSFSLLFPVIKNK
ncbi:MAG: hypothetical protein C4539_05525 [Ignavibacteriales bacterium]|nr:MAG: hypothetical protein C4539_05525 [Ignavibacteriales bacterium]